MKKEQKERKTEKGPKMTTEKKGEKGKTKEQK